MMKCGIVVVMVGMLWGGQIFGAEKDVVINEVLADPPAGDRGDANRDGNWPKTNYEDEFVEILNTGSDTVAIGGWELSDKKPGSKGPFTFPPDTKIAPGEYIVLFGGGDEGKIKSKFEGKVFVDDGKIGGGLTNSGDAVFLIKTEGDTIAKAEWGKEGGKDQSLVRYPEGTGRWVLHSADPGKGLFSPGKSRSLFDKLESLPEYLDLIEGEFVSLIPVIYSYETGETRRIEDEVLWVSWDTTVVRIEHGNKVVAVRAGETEVGFFWRGRESLHTYIRVLEKEKPPLVISEVYPNPAWGDAGDTNGDGVRHTYQDEFIEVANQGKNPIDIGGYFLGDDDASIDRLFRFPDNTVLDTQAVVVLFGGGDMPLSERIFADDGRIGDGLSNWSDTVQLLAPDSSTVAASMVYERSTRGVSFVRDDNGNYVLHNQIYEEDSTSVGRLKPGDDPIEPEGLTDTLTVPDGIAFSEILMLPEQVDANNDGIVDRHADAFVELTNIGVDTLDLSGWMIGDDDIIVSRFFPFPDDVILVPGGYITIFGGGTPVGIPGTVLSAGGQIGNGLSSGGDVVHLILPDSKTVARSVRVPKATPDVSWLFSPDAPPKLHPQISGRHAMSPGTSSDGQEGPSIDTANRDTLDTQFPKNLVISEVYPNPAAGDAGDTNGDGGRHTYQDEFVEIANLGVHPIDIGGYYLGDDDVPVEKLFRFPDSTVLDTQAVVVLFGGGDMPLSERIFADDGRIGDGLSNGGDTVQLLAPDGSTVISKMTYKNAPKGISFARDDNGNYLLHNQIYEEENISVGRLGQGDDPDQHEGLTVSNDIVFSEILMLPEQVDANNDGIVDRHADAFVELTNIGVDTLDLSGWMIGDDDIIVSRFFPFPDDVILVPGGYITIFGGGTPVGIPGTVLSAGGQIGNGLSSGGDVVHLILPDSKTVARSVRVPKATPDVSWLFSPDAPPKLHPQISGRQAMSPGTSSIAEAESDTLIGVDGVSGKPSVSEGKDQTVNSPISDDSKLSGLAMEDHKWGIYPAPNPFNTTTVLGFYTSGGPVDVTIYNILGQPIRQLVQQHLPAGYYRRIWDGKNDFGVSVSSGIYIVFLKDKKATFTQRVALLK
ncbi:MAG: lamin tail domain-containing protein [Gemmatimonadota bacterium]|nr:lamin tail domain-containing protein [Gemmatimonadota bacterium]